MGNPQKSKGQNGTSIADIAEKIGETERTAETEVINISKLDKMSKLQNNRFWKSVGGVRDGRPKKLGQNVQVSKTTADIAEAIGESEKTTRRLIKINDLIPRLKKRG